MSRYTHDILTNDKHFSIEIFNFQPNISMNTSHFHDHYEILYVLSGERELIINDINHYILDAETLAIIPPNYIHQTKSHSKDGQTRICIALSDEFVNSIKQFTSESITYCLEFNIIKLDYTIKKSVRDILSALLMFDDHHFIHEYQKALSAQLFILLSQYTKKTKKTHVPKQSYNNISLKKRMNEIVKYIQQHAHEQISLESISKNYSFEKTYLSRCFKEYTGTTLVTYLNSIRIAEAQQLLLNNDISISTIAYTVGFNNRIYFDRIFKRITGLSPKQFQLKFKELTRE